MPRFLRLSLLLVPFVIGALAQALPGRAQQAISSRYAFADTTLLRDTLGLDFGRLFPTADSLQLLPDTLRALMIRYRLPMPRMITMADSLGIPVDSVGPRLYRERLNPLAGGARSTNSFHYNSGYTVGQTNSVWTNGSEYQGLRGAAYFNNSTNIQMERYKSAGFTSLRQTREATTESGLRLSTQHSLGGRLHLFRYDSQDGPSSSQKETLNEFSFTGRTRRQSSRNLLAEMNALAGYLADDKAGTEVKRGLSGKLDGHVRTASGTWFSNDVTAGFTTNLARTRRPTAIQELRALDAASNLQGTLTLYGQAPVGLNVNYNLRRTRVDTPSDSGTITHIRQTSDGIGATVRMRRDNERNVNFTGSLGRSTQATGTRLDSGVKLVARWTVVGWALDANYGDSHSRSQFPLQRGAYGYNENDLSRSADATFSRSLTQKLLTKLNGQISLGQFRYSPTSEQATPPTPRDSYRQSYRIDTQYNQSERLNTGLAGEVSLTRSINIDVTTASSNYDTRSYRAEWHWSYRLMTGLSVIQNNTITADYNFYPFAIVRNALSLNYNTITTVSAVVTPRLNIDVQHITQQQPRGDYQKLGNNQEYLKLSDESRNYSLRSSITYSPSPALSFQLRPEYQTSSRTGTSNGVSEKQRDDKKLNFSGGVNLNLRLGKKGTLSGNIARTFNDQRTINYQGGIASPTPASAQDYWNGSLQLTWGL